MRPSVAGPVETRNSGRALTNISGKQHYSVNVTGTRLWSHLVKHLLEISFTRVLF